MVGRVHAVDGGGVDIRVVDLEFLAEEILVDGLFLVFALETVVGIADVLRVKTLVDVCELDVVKGVEILTQNPDGFAVGLAV